MQIKSKFNFTILFLTLVGASLTAPAASANELTNESRAALRNLVEHNPAARRASENATAVLVFPDVVKAGFMFGGEGGDGILFVNGEPRGRYRTFAASYGLQAGVQKFGYALFFMNQKAVDWINQTRGWEIGTGPSVVVVDQGMAKTFSTDTLHSGIYAFTFDQKGLMAGMGIQGSKIMRLD